jgi:hypothetical protein
MKLPETPRVPAIVPRDLDNLRHMLGADSNEPGYRNHFTHEPDHAGMLRLMALGWVWIPRPPAPGELVTFVATEAGCRAAGLDAAATVRALGRGQTS